MPAPNRILLGLALIVLGAMYVVWGASVVQDALRPRWEPRWHGDDPPARGVPVKPPEPPPAPPAPTARRPSRGGKSS